MPITQAPHRTFSPTLATTRIRMLTVDEVTADQSTVPTYHNEKPEHGPLSRSGKRVSFSSYRKVMQIPHIRDYSKEEVESIWISKKDYARTKKELKRCADLHFRNQLPIHESSRGLETKAQKIQRRDGQLESIHAVLNEQHLQRVEGSGLPELVSMIYSIFSFPSQQEAHSQALRDAKEAGRDGLDMDFELDSEMPQPGCQVLQKIAGEQNVSGEEALAGVEDWLVERFQRGQQVIEASRKRTRQYAMETE